MSNYMPKANKWTLGLCAMGAVSLASVVQAEEKQTAISALTPTVLSGYVDTSANWNPGTGVLNLPAYTPNGLSGTGQADGFNLGVVAVTLGKPAESEAKWSAGYNVTMLYGPNAVGYNPSANSTGTSDFSLMDTYVELRAPLGNGLDFKLGTFSEPLGYEVYATGSNPNFTRSYGYEIEPTQMTGLAAAYQFSPVFSASAGVFDVWSGGVNKRGNPPEAESYKTYMGTLTLTAPPSAGFLAGSSLLGGIINGWDAANQVVKTSFYIGGTMNTPIKNVKLGIAYDYVALGANTISGISESSGYQNATGAYLLWQPTEKLSLNTRAEYFSQSEYLANTSAGLTGGQTRSPSKAVGVTATVQYEVWKNVLSRVEFRWDHAADGSQPYQTVPVGLDNTFLLALNIVYKF